ncbi:flavin reductase family protein [Streptomyces sp. NPDC005374]|uniref:flavin reductase family protein n=1 Tax=Streptomyces sp. NPDC005374 TaxID=3364713 RepID=UPI0036D184F9
MSETSPRAVLETPRIGESRTPVVALDAAELDAETLRQAFGCFPSGVVAVCALVDGAPAGMAVSSFTSVSIGPPLLSVCVQDTSATWPKLRDRRRLGLSVLAEGQDLACRRLAGKDENRFADVQWHSSLDGAVFLDGAAAMFDCSLHAELPGGDHTIALLEIQGLCMVPVAAPLVFHGSRFRSLASHDPQ